MNAPFRRAVLMLSLLLASACAMPPRVLAPSTQPVIGAYRFWSCDKSCAFTEEPTRETRLTTLVLFPEPPGFNSQGPGTANACWLGDPPQSGHAGTGTWRLDPDGVARLVLAAKADSGAVLHLSIQGDTITGSIETWSCNPTCQKAWYAVDGVRIGKPAIERCQP